MRTDRSLGLLLGVSLGAVALAAVAAFGVLLPKAHGEDAVDLPDTLPGGWTAVDVPDALPGDTAERRAEAVGYVNDVYAEVYDEPVAFRAYVDDDQQDVLAVTVFAGEGGAFGPPSGLADPEAQGLARASTELVHEDDATCIATYQPVPEGQPATDPPLGVVCQVPADGHTVQVTSNGLEVAETVDLAHDVVEAL